MMAPDNSAEPPDPCGFSFPSAFFFVLTASTCLLSSSSWALQNSCSMEQSSSLNNPTSSQFFKKRVGVGVWSENGKTCHFKIIYNVINLFFSCACRDKKCSIFKTTNVFLYFGFRATKPPPCERKTVHLRARFS